MAKGLQVEATPSGKALGGNHLDPFNSQRTARKLAWLRENDQRGRVKGNTVRKAIRVWQSLAVALSEMGSHWSIFGFGMT